MCDIFVAIYVNCYMWVQYWIDNILCANPTLLPQSRDSWKIYFITKQNVWYKCLLLDSLHRIVSPPALLKGWYVLGHLKSVPGIAAYTIVQCICSQRVSLKMGKPYFFGWRFPSGLQCSSNITYGYCHYGIYGRLAFKWKNFTIYGTTLCLVYPEKILAWRIVSTKTYTRGTRDCCTVSCLCLIVEFGVLCCRSVWLLQRANHSPALIFSN